MYKNRALIDRALDMTSNNNAVMTYRKLISLIEEYNRIARDKGLPIKKIPVYNDDMNCTLMLRSISNILRDIDRIKGIRNEEDEEKTARDVEFTIGIVTDFPDKPAWKEDGSLWYYIQNGDNICVYADTNAMIDRINGGTSLELDYSDMPYELLVDRNGIEWKVNSYTMYDSRSRAHGLFGIRVFQDDWLNNVIGKLTSLTLRNWTNRNVTDMQYMFGGCSGLTTLTLGENFNTSAVENMQSMFYYCSELTELTLGENFDTSNVTEMQNMFNRCSKLTTLDLSRFNTIKVENMRQMFYKCSKLTILDLSSFDTGSVKNMSDMFSGCVKLSTLDLSSFDTSAVENMQQMFYDCSELTELTLGENFNTIKVENMRQMFYRCSKLTTLNLSSFNTIKVADMREMFYYCSELTELTLGENFDTSNVMGMSDMFRFCDGLQSVSLYKSANSVIAYLPSGTWNVNNGAGTVTLTRNVATPTWEPSTLPNDWGENEQWTLTLQPSASS